MMNNTVSVIVACYNQGQYLTEAVESVLAQTYPDWECIIVNDGSADNSEDVASQLIKRDSRISYYKINNSGVLFVRNFGVEKSKGDYILPLDADDKIDETYIEKALSIFQSNNVKLVYCEGSFFGAKQGIFKLPDYSQEELAKMNMIFCSAVFKRQDFVAAGGYNLNMKLGWEDWDLWIEMLQHGGSVYKIPEVLFYYRINEVSRTKSLEGARKQKMFMQLYLNHPDFFDRFYDEPLDAFQNYRDLKDYSKTIEDAYNTLKGLLSLKPSSYKRLAKRLWNGRGK